MGIISPDLAAYPSDKPDKQIHLLFIHHSCGGQLLADRGEVKERSAGTRIFLTHPNGGGLRAALTRNNYAVHEASIGSRIGAATDVCHWNRKFADWMDDILRCSGQDRLFEDSTRNAVVVFKSCFSGSLIDSEGSEPGDPDSPEKTAANYRAAYRSLLASFRKQPGTLFVVFTSPPLAAPVRGIVPTLVQAVRNLLGRSGPADEAGLRIRAFNDWLKDEDDGWLSEYELNNVVVFDYYDILTGHGRSNWSVYPTARGKDSHPSSEGNSRAAQVFIPFLNKAVRRMDI
ncbi:MAG TPA: hypothetical protein PLA83_05490 [Deltaproteobacteria bacterium]|nr:hypothetical protein [Deltaproteobacteria bacterium]